MKILELQQGTAEWHAHRASHFNASDAPAMMGLSPYKTRSELLREMATGITPEIDAATQRRFDDGHRFEALARPVAEKILGEDLFPVVGYEGKLSASFDGLTMDGTVCFEHKTLNAAYREAIATGSPLPAVLLVQIEQQLMLADATRCLFMASRWNDDETLAEEVHCFVESDPELRKALIQEWAQFAEDLANYKHVEPAPVAVAAPQMALPAVSVQVQGSIAIIDNLAAFGDALDSYVSRINRKPETDQDFADLEATVKTLKTAEEALDAAENNALGQAASIDAMRRTVALYRNMARETRLVVDKLVKAEKENRKAAIVTAARQAVEDHIAKLNQRIGGNWMPQASAAPFVDAIKGLKSLDSMRDKVSGALANEKIRMNEVADLIEANRKSLLIGTENDTSHLFPDFAQVCTKAREDFAALHAMRIQHEAVRKEAAIAAAKKAEDARVAAAVEAERMAEAKRAAEAAQPVDIRATPEQKQAAVIEHQDEIAEFMASREWGKDAGKIRAALVEFVKFQASKNLRVAA